MLEPGVLSPTKGICIETPMSPWRQTEGSSRVSEFMPLVGIFELLALMEGGKGRGMEGGREAD